MGFVNFVDAQMSKYSPYYDQFLMENIRKINKLFNTEVGRDINLPTKVRLVKAIVFPVVMYGCESWIVKKAEHQKIHALELWC